MFHNFFSKFSFDKYFENFSISKADNFTLKKKYLQSYQKSLAYKNILWSESSYHFYDYRYKNLFYILMYEFFEQFKTNDNLLAQDILNTLEKIVFYDSINTNKYKEKYISEIQHLFNGYQEFIENKENYIFKNLETKNTQDFIFDFDHKTNKQNVQYIMSAHIIFALYFLSCMDIDNKIKDSSKYFKYFENYLFNKKLQFYKAKLNSYYFLFLMSQDVIHRNKLQNSFAYDFINKLKFGLNYSTNFSQSDIFIDKNLKNISLSCVISTLYQTKNISQYSHIKELNYYKNDFLFRQEKKVSDNHFNLIKEMFNHFYWPSNQNSQYQIRNCLKQFLISCARNNYSYELFHQISKNQNFEYYKKTSSSSDAKKYIDIRLSCFIDSVAHIMEQEKKLEKLYFLDKQAIAVNFYYTLFSSIFSSKIFPSNLHIDIEKIDLKLNELQLVQKSLNRLNSYVLDFLKEKIIDNNLSPKTLLLDLFEFSKNSYKTSNKNFIHQYKNHIISMVFDNLITLFKEKKLDFNEDFMFFIKSIQKESDHSALVINLENSMFKNNIFSNIENQSLKKINKI